MFKLFSRHTLGAYFFMETVLEKIQSGETRDFILEIFRNTFESHEFHPPKAPRSLFPPEEENFIRLHLSQAREGKNTRDQEKSSIALECLRGYIAQCKELSLSESGEKQTQMRARYLHVEFLISTLYQNTHEYTEKLVYLAEALSLPEEYPNGRITDEILLRRHLLALEAKVAVMMAEGHDFALINHSIGEFIERSAAFKSQEERELIQTQVYYMQQARAVILHELGNDQASLALFQKLAEDREISSDAYFWRYLQFISTFGSIEEIHEILNTIENPQEEALCEVERKCFQIKQSPKKAASLVKRKESLQIKLLELCESIDEFEFFKSQFLQEQGADYDPHVEFEARMLIAEGKLRGDRHLVEMGIHRLEQSVVGYHADSARFSTYFLPFFDEIRDHHGEESFKDLVIKSLRCLEAKLEQMLIHFSVAHPKDESLSCFSAEGETRREVGGVSGLLRVSTQNLPVSPIFADIFKVLRKLFAAPEESISSFDLMQRVLSEDRKRVKHSTRAELKGKNEFQCAFGEWESFSEGIRERFGKKINVTIFRRNGSGFEIVHQDRPLDFQLDQNTTLSKLLSSKNTSKLPAVFLDSKRSYPIREALVIPQEDHVFLLDQGNSIYPFSETDEVILMGQVASLFNSGKAVQTLERIQEATFQYEWHKKGEDDYWKSCRVSEEAYMSAFAMHRSPDALFIGSIHIPTSTRKKYVAVMGLDPVGEEPHAHDIFMQGQSHPLWEYYLRHKDQFGEIVNIAIHSPYTDSAPSSLSYLLAKNALRLNIPKGIALANTFARRMFDKAGVSYEAVGDAIPTDHIVNDLKEKLGMPEAFLQKWLPMYIEATSPQIIIDYE